MSGIVSPPLFLHTHLAPMRLKEAVSGRVSQHTPSPGISEVQCGTEPTPTVSISEAYQGGIKAELVGSLLLPLPLVSARPTRELNLHFHLKIREARAL